MTERSSVSKKVVAVIAAGLLVVGAGASAFVTNGVNQNTITEQASKITELESAEPTIVEVPVEVEVDNGKLELVLNHIYDNDGNVSYLTEDLDDDEVALIADRIVFVNEVKKLAVDAVKDGLFEELDDNDFEWTGDDGGPKFNKEDLRRLRVDDEPKEVIVDEDINYEDGEALVTVEGTFRDISGVEPVEYTYTAIVKFDNGEFDELEDIKVSPAE